MVVAAIGTDLKKLFGDYHIYLCMIGLGLINILGYLCSLSSGVYRFGYVSSYRGVAESSELLLLAFLLCVVGGSLLYCAEEKYGYLNFEIQRVGVGRYTVSKLLTSFIGGFCTLVASSFIFLCGIIVHHYFALGVISFGNEEWTGLFWMWMFAALRCGLLSVIGFLVSTYVPNYYIAMTMPLLIYYAILQVQHWIWVFFPTIPMQYQFSKIYMSGIIGDDMERFAFAVVYTACLCLIMYFMAKRCIERRLEHA